jgi:hypothetical protein
MRVLLFGLMALGAAGQPLAVGVKAGPRLTNDFNGWAESESRRYAVGPAVEFRLPRRFAVEVDALYRRVGYRSDNADIFGGMTYIRSRSSSWEFPLLLKRRFPCGLFVSGGIAPRTQRFTETTTGFWVDFSGARTEIPRFEYTYDREASLGYVGGAGIEFPAGRLRIAPEVRYTRWNNSPVSISGSRGYFVESQRNQVEVLLGFSWR